MIDEKKLIDELDRKLYAMQIVSRSAVLDIIKEQPKVGEWIPCSERLPEEDGRYLCFWGTGVMQVFRFSNDLYAVDAYDFAEYKGKKEKGFYDYDSEYGYAEIDWITAWMPLPEPYKEEGTGHKEE